MPIDLNTNPLEITKFISPGFRDGTKGLAPKAYLGKLVSNIKEIATVNYARVVHLWNTLSLVNNSTVIQKLRDHVTNLTVQLEKSPKKLDNVKFILNNVEDIKKVCEHLEKAGVKKNHIEELTEGIDDLKSSTAITGLRTLDQRINKLQQRLENKKTTKDRGEIYTEVNKLKGHCAVLKNTGIRPRKISTLEGRLASLEESILSQSTESTKAADAKKRVAENIHRLINKAEKNGEFGPRARKELQSVLEEDLSRDSKIEIMANFTIAFRAIERGFKENIPEGLTKIIDAIHEDLAKFE